MNRSNWKQNVLNRTCTRKVKKLNYKGLRVAPEIISTIPVGWRYRISPAISPTSNKTLDYERPLNKFRHNKLQTTRKRSLMNKLSLNELCHSRCQTRETIFLMNKKAPTEFRQKKFAKMRKFRLMKKRRRPRFATKNARRRRYPV